MKHQGKVAVVTGAAQGIGLACAARLHAEGARVIMGDVQADKVVEAAAVLDSSGKTAIGMASDVSQRGDVAALVQRAVDDFGQLDIMVNNAGLGVSASVLDLTEEDFDRIMGINLK
ncbi:MAG: SDR family NAD(P)-dependent oxidoreductase, partial [Rhodospirillaceae bacterium]|nr:SDR family NAD(P)-dependent oxidoreductase [Rhodospirillaceae bacterium]